MLLMVNAAVAQDMLCVYPHKASPDTLALQDVKSITHSRTDLNGVRHADFAVMEIELTNGRQRRYDITALDSVVMVKDGLHSHLVRFTGTMAARPSGAKPRYTSLSGDFEVKKATVDFFWEDGDHIYLEDGRRDTLATISSTKATADFFFGGDKVTADKVTVYYAGQSPQQYNEVVVATSQQQDNTDDSRHIGRGGDCGTAVAERQNDGSYTFALTHHAAYLCFLPYIGNGLGRTVLKKITVRSDSAIAGTFTLSTDGIKPKTDTTHCITLTTGNFILPEKVSQTKAAAYMVIAPQNGSTRLTCDFTVCDTILGSTGTLRKYIDLDEVLPNTVYVIKANVNNYAVDLGLPVQFLNHNYGASSPEEAGNYYAFGETTDKGVNDNNNTYKFYSTYPGDDIRLTDNDVAHMRLGETFSIPSYTEMNMLTDNCKWTWMSVNGINGYKITGKNGNSIFMPAAGYRSGTGVSEYLSRGCYRTSMLVGDGEKRNWYLNFSKSSKSIPTGGTVEPTWGMSIRPVISNSMTTFDGTRLQVSTDSVQWHLGQGTATLFASVNGLKKAKVKRAKTGFVVSTSNNPTIANGAKLPVKTTTDGRYSTVYTLSESPDTTVYYYRAYVENGDSVSYGFTHQFGNAIVDLALPSGNRWAAVNIGANSPDESGTYFAFGETEAKGTYSQNNYTWYKQSTYYNPDGLWDIQATRNDAAAKTWGSVWMMPSYDDYTELRSNCNMKDTVVNGTKGYLFKSKKNGKSIFIALTGYYNSSYSSFANYEYLTVSRVRDNYNNCSWSYYNKALNNDRERISGLPIRAVYKTNAKAANGKPLFVRTLQARKYYDGSNENDTLIAVVRGLSTENTATTGIVWWRAGKGRDKGQSIDLTPDADGYISTVVVPDTVCADYRYQAYVSDGKSIYYGDSLSFTSAGVVDLGLSVCWANVNLGAESSYADGNYYRWGATRTYRNATDEYIKNVDILPESGRDAAANSWGAGYRMPTKAEMQELLDNCDKVYTTVNGQNGWRFTSKKAGYTTKSIFIALGGYYEGECIKNKNSFSRYWASNYDGGYGSSYGSEYNNKPYLRRDYKSYGYLIRPVRQKSDYVSTPGITRDFTDDAEHIILKGYVSDIQHDITAKGFVLGDSANITVASAQQIAVSAAAVNGYYSYDLGVLDRGRTYYYRAYIYDGSKYTYGDAKSFTTTDYVDLGLASGTLWANHNVLADNPESYGGYFAWGEAETKDSYTEANYKYYQNNKYIDIGKNIAGTQYDAATKNMGTLWQTPTQQQCKELADSCTWTETTVNGVAVWKVASKKNGNYIILPKAGRYNGTSDDVSGQANYMTATMYNSYDYYYLNDFWIPNGGKPQSETGNCNNRYKGYTVRPVLSAKKGSGSYPVNMVSNVSWAIDDATASFTTSASTIEDLTGADCGYIVGSKPEDIDSYDNTSNEKIAATPALKPGNRKVTFSCAYTYDGTPKYFRSYIHIGDEYVLGDIRAITAADMLDVEFRNNGTAFIGNGFANNVVRYGSPTTTYDETYKRYVADFSKNVFADSYSSAPDYYSCSFENLPEFQAKLQQSYSMEVLIRTPKTIPNNNESDAFSDYESGGSGIQIQNKKIGFSWHIGGSYKQAFTKNTVNADTWYHVIITWDKTNGKVSLYVDGELEGTVDAAGEARLPNSGSRYYIVGGNPTGTSNQMGYNGSVAFARIYGSTLSADQVKTLYDNLKK